MIAGLYVGLGLSGGKVFHKPLNVVLGNVLHPLSAKQRFNVALDPPFVGRKGAWFLGFAPFSKVEVAQLGNGLFCFVGASSSLEYSGGRRIRATLHTNF